MYLDGRDWREWWASPYTFTSWLGSLTRTHWWKSSTQMTKCQCFSMRSSLPVAPFKGPCVILTRLPSGIEGLNSTLKPENRAFSTSSSSRVNPSWSWTCRTFLTLPVSYRNGLHSRPATDTYPGKRGMKAFYGQSVPVMMLGVRFMSVFLKARAHGAVDALTANDATIAVTVTIHCGWCCWGGGCSLVPVLECGIQALLLNRSPVTET